MSVQINNITDVPCLLYNPENVLVGTITDHLQFCDVRLQIKRRNLEGYYVMFNGQKILIKPNGEPETWPLDFFDMLDNLLSKLYDV